MTTAAATRSKITYDTQTCGRCLGTGHYSYNRMDGTRCYGCSGSGRRLTKPAARSRELLKQWTAEHLTVPASTLQPGDRIYVNTIERGWKWLTVESIEVDLQPRYRGGGSQGVEGSESYIAYSILGNTTIRTVKGRTGFAGAAHRPVQRTATPEQSAAYYAYAATLPGITVTTA
jgi:hypothetical protein